MHFSVWHTCTCSRNSCYIQIKSVGTQREACSAVRATFLRLHNSPCIHKAQVVLTDNLLQVAQPPLHTHNPAKNTNGSIGTNSKCEWFQLDQLFSAGPIQAVFFGWEGQTSVLISFVPALPALSFQRAGSQWPLSRLFWKSQLIEALSIPQWHTHPGCWFAAPFFIARVDKGPPPAPQAPPRITNSKVILV